MNKKLLISAAAAGIMMASSSALADDHKGAKGHKAGKSAKEAHGTCVDDNTCHKKGACGADKGKNSCGGHTFDSTEAQCKATGGKWSKKG